MIFIYSSKTPPSAYFSFLSGHVLNGLSLLIYISLYYNKSKLYSCVWLHVTSLISKRKYINQCVNF